MPLSIVDGLPTTGDFQGVLVLELDFNAAPTQAKHEPGFVRRLGIEHHAFRVKCAKVELCSKPKKVRRILMNKISKKLNLTKT